MGSRGKKLLLVVLLACLVFTGIAGYGDFREVGSLLVEFPAGYWLMALGLALLNYFLRFLRWAWYLKVLRIDVPRSVSLLTFCGGLAMTITPGKVGELVKSYLLRDRCGVPVASSMPIVLMERLTDLVSIALMGLVGLALLPPVVSLGLAIVLALVAVAIYLLSTLHTDRLLALPVIRRWGEEIRQSRRGMRELSRPAPMAVALSLGLLSWASEGLALWVVLKGLGADLGVLLSLPIYAGSVLVGAATTLPGGLVGTEGTMVALLQQFGAERDIAAAGTLLVRVATLWFAVGVGLAALAWLHRLPIKASVDNPQGNDEGVTVERELPSPANNLTGEGKSRG